jgi:hypothetical protein
MSIYPATTILLLNLTAKALCFVALSLLVNAMRKGKPGISGKQATQMTIATLDSLFRCAATK